MNTAARDTLDGPPAVRSRSRRIGFRAAAVALGLFVGLAILEVAVRVTGVAGPPVLSRRQLQRTDSQPGRLFHCYSSNPHGELAPVPDVSQGTWVLSNAQKQDQLIPLRRLAESPFCVEYTFSNQGLRDVEYSRQPPPGTLRICMVGDSFVYGEGVPVEKTLPRQMQTMLGPGYEVVNGGFPGWSTAEETAQAKAIVEGLGCQRVVLVFLLNDVRLSPELVARRQAINDLVLFRDDKLDTYYRSRWWGMSKLLTWLGPKVDMHVIARQSLQWYLDSYDERYNAANLRLLREQLAEFARTFRGRSVVVLYPILTGLEGKYPLQQIHDRVKQMAAEMALDAIDLAPSFEGTPSRDFWVHPADFHPNGRAHELAARTIIAWLRNHRPGFLDANR